MTFGQSHDIWTDDPGLATGLLPQDQGVQAGRYTRQNAQAVTAAYRRAPTRFLERSREFHRQALAGPARQPHRAGQLFYGAGEFTGSNAARTQEPHGLSLTRPRPSSSVLKSGW
jgi:hypothetical protein